MRARPFISLADKCIEDYEFSMYLDLFQKQRVNVSVKRAAIVRPFRAKKILRWCHTCDQFSLVVICEKACRKFIEHWDNHLTQCKTELSIVKS